MHVFINFHRLSGRTQSGSGVLVAPHMVVTNCHTIWNAHSISVTGAAGAVPAHLVRTHAERDLCLLNAPRLTGIPVALGSTAGKQAGDLIIAIGYPAGATVTISTGHIEGLFTYQGPGRVIQGSAYFSPGKSGGGLFDQHGSLIGILTFKCNAGGPYHFAVPAEWVDNLLHEGHDKNPVAKPASAPAGKPFWQHTDARQPLFLRAASLSAEGNCKALNELAADWMAREPDNADAAFVAQRAQHCNILALIQRPLLEK